LYLSLRSVNLSDGVIKISIFFIFTYLYTLYTVSSYDLDGLKFKLSFCFKKVGILSKFKPMNLRFFSNVFSDSFVVFAMFTSCIFIMFYIISYGCVLFYRKKYF